MSENFLNPFQVTPQGRIAVTSDPDLIARQRVNSIIGTGLGGRVMIPDYGVGLPHHLFDPGVEQSMDQIATDINNQLQIWEPSINVLSITPDQNQAAQGVVNINVDFTQSNDPSFTPVLTATVLVGGKVVNN